MNNCPCGSGLAYDACCGPIIAGAPAATAEALMRSRYSAYVQRAYAHLGRTLSAEQRKDFDVVGQAVGHQDGSGLRGEHNLIHRRIPRTGRDLIRPRESGLRRESLAPIDDLTHRALVMGILNRTPDSFFDRGATYELEALLVRAEQLVDEGADILDVGGVKAGPGDEVSDTPAQASPSSSPSPHWRPPSRRRGAAC